MCRLNPPVSASTSSTGAGSLPGAAARKARAHSTTRSAACTATLALATAAADPLAAAGLASYKLPDRVEFLDAFPESAHMVPPELEPLTLSGDEAFDLVILPYQVWYLAPSQPITAFLQQDIDERSTLSQSFDALQKLSGQPLPKSVRPRA